MYGKVYGIKSNEEERFERSGVMNFIAYCHPDTSTDIQLQNEQTKHFLNSFLNDVQQNQNGFNCQ